MFDVKSEKENKNVSIVQLCFSIIKTGACICSFPNSFKNSGVIYVGLLSLTMLYCPGRRGWKWDNRLHRIHNGYDAHEPNGQRRPSLQSF